MSGNESIMLTRLDHLDDDKVLSLVEAAHLLGLEPITLDTLAHRRAYGLKSKVVKAKRMFVVNDLRAFLTARARTAA